MEGVKIQMQENGDGKGSKAEIIDASALQPFDVTSTYSFVDSHYHVMLSEACSTALPMTIALHHIRLKINIIFTNLIRIRFIVQCLLLQVVH